MNIDQLIHDGWWSKESGKGDPREHFDRWGNKINTQITVLDGLTQMTHQAVSGLVQTIREHPVATAVVVTTVVVGTTILTGGATAPALAAVF